jgi:hypothetical protein
MIRCTQCEERSGCGRSKDGLQARLRAQADAEQGHDQHRLLNEGHSFPGSRVAELAAWEREESRRSAARTERSSRWSETLPISHANRGERPDSIGTPRRAAPFHRTKRDKHPPLCLSDPGQAGSGR